MSFNLPIWHGVKNVNYRIFFNNINFVHVVFWLLDKFVKNIKIFKLFYIDMV